MSGILSSDPAPNRNPLERVTLGRPVIDTNHAQVHAGKAFSLINTITVAQSKVGAIQIYVPGEDEATVTIDMTNANADLTYTAVNYGPAGNSITVTHVDPGANDQALAVSVDGNDITVSLATGPAGAITSTAAQVKAAVNAHNQVKLLVVCEDEGDGSGVVEAKTQTSLAGGANPVYVHFQAVDVNCNAGPGSVSLLEDYWLASEVGASALTPKNHHRISNPPSLLTVKALADTTATTGGGEAAGTSLAVLPMHGTGVGTNKVTSDNGVPQEWVMLPGKKYLIAFSHSYAGSVTFGYNLFWYEEEGA